jgi:sialic acid synthase SpsE
MKIKTIAEIGINHNGDMDTATRLISIAGSAGVDCVKFQKRTPDKCVPEHQKNVVRETPWGNMTYLDYKKKIEFGQKEYDAIDTYCRMVGVPWAASAWDTDSVAFLSQYDIPFIKIPSALITDEALLKSVRLTGKPAILSTGMSTLDMVDNAMSILGDKVICVMHCVSTYPSTAEEQNLNNIHTLKMRYPNTPIGFSNHFTGITFIPVVAALGAAYIEFHITLDRSSWGTDQAASIEPEGVHKIVKWLRNIEVGMGSYEKKILDSEIPIMKKLRG